MLASLTGAIIAVAAVVGSALTFGIFLYRKYTNKERAVRKLKEKVDVLTDKIGFVMQKKPYDPAYHNQLKFDRRVLNRKIARLRTP